MEIEVRRGDITEQADVDAIVNAANTDLVLGSGVAGAIRRKGGENINREATAQAPIRLGEAVATSAGQMTHKYVIHAAAMGYREEDQAVPKRAGSLSSPAIIRNATQNSLRIADRVRLGSIAFPALATGVAGFPVGECADVMIGATREYASAHPETSVQRVVFVLWSAEDYHTFHSRLQKQ
jgi:O-acetyl-ADP-ribose deacetylase (regulator of RNase III)